MPRVVALVDDLLFLSRMREAARPSGVEVLSARDAADLIAAVREGARLVVVDADGTRLPWSDAVAALRAESRLPPVPVVAFFSHVDADRGAAARSAGCDRVVPRGAFVRELPGLLAEAARGPHPEEPAP